MMTRVIASSFAAMMLLTSCWGARVYTEYDEGYPPEAYIATATPVYYEGYPSYYYGNRWYRREGTGWRAYGQEPEYLRSYRANSPVYRQSYGRGQYYGQPSVQVHAAVPVNRGYSTPARVAPPPPPSYHGAAPVRGGGRHR